MRACRHCGRKGRFYPSDEPTGFVAWFAWAERKGKTHEQQRCPGCDRFNNFTRGLAQPKKWELCYNAPRPLVKGLYLST